VNIHFDTIHGVKGETHKATLYLETFTRLYDIGGKILKFIAGSERDQKKYRRDGAIKKRLPLAYVALTRATHFICLAVHKDRFEGDVASYFQQSDDWDVLEINPGEVVQDNPAADTFFD
jgi:ATP-dependent exoDNAse (exonuclease V) beta subunit